MTGLKASGSGQPTNGLLSVERRVQRNKGLLGAAAPPQPLRVTETRRSRHSAYAASVLTLVPRCCMVHHIMTFIATNEVEGIAVLMVRRCSSIRSPVVSRASSHRDADGATTGQLLKNEWNTPQ